MELIQSGWWWWIVYLKFSHIIANQIILRIIRLSRTKRNSQISQAPREVHGPVESNQTTGFQCRTANTSTPTIVAMPDIGKKKTWLHNNPGGESLNDTGIWSSFFLTQTSFCVCADLSGWSDTDSRPIHDVDRRITNLAKSKWAGKSPQIKTSPQKASHDGILHPNTSMKLQKNTGSQMSNRASILCLYRPKERPKEKVHLIKPYEWLIQAFRKWNFNGHHPPHCKWYSWKSPYDRCWMTFREIDLW